MDDDHGPASGSPSPPRPGSRSQSHPHPLPDADPGTVAVVVDGVRASGVGVDLGTLPLPETPPSGRVVAAIRAGPVDGLRVDWSGAGADGGPGAVHGHVGHLRPDVPLDLRGALASAARSRGARAPEADALAEARDALAAHDAGADVDVEAAERRVAEAGEAERDLRERVATLRGRLQALRDVADDDGGSVATAEADYRAAIRELSEVETERIAARQRLAAAREERRRVRDARRRRLELQDRVANLERDARRSLAATVYDEFAAAVAALPGEGTAGDAPGDYEGPPATAALAVARIAAVDAPLVDALGRFPDARTAARRLGAPVVGVPGDDD